MGLETETLRSRPHTCLEGRQAKQKPKVKSIPSVKKISSSNPLRFFFRAARPDMERLWEKWIDKAKK